MYSCWSAGNCVGVRKLSGSQKRQFSIENQKGVFFNFYFPVSPFNKCLIFLLWDKPSGSSVSGENDRQDVGANLTILLAGHIPWVWLSVCVGWVWLAWPRLPSMTGLPICTSSVHHTSWSFALLASIIYWKSWYSKPIFFHHERNYCCVTLHIFNRVLTVVLWSLILAAKRVICKTLTSKTLSEFSVSI